MKKRLIKLLSIILVFVVLCLGGCKKTDFTTGAAEPPKLVPEAFAKEIAVKFDVAKFENSGTTVNGPSGNNTITSQTVITDKNKRPALYVFNFDKNQGFVIVSADFSLRPILAYVHKGVYDNNKMPEGLRDWINKTVENVEVTRDGLYDNTKESSLAWNRYIKEFKVNIKILSKQAPIDPDPCTNIPPPTSTIVGPLLPVTWGQSCTYNDLCALNQGFNCGGCSIRPLTGCVATSMAMVFRFHQFPNNYTWATMPATFGNGAVQQLMSDAGVSVNMSYGCNGSSAYEHVVDNAIKNSFGYSSANRWSYSQSSYNYGYGRVKDNIKYNHWPVILQGHHSENEGHQWVCDGTAEYTYYYCVDGPMRQSVSSDLLSITYLMFHMNWGWHEDWMNGTNATDFNGWFAFDNWFIPGANLNFQYYRYAISEIHP